MSPGRKSATRQSYPMSPAYRPQTRVLTLADGSVVFGCQQCDYTDANSNSNRLAANSRDYVGGGDRPATLPLAGKPADRHPS